MNATQQLHDLGQSLWLDNITRDLLDNGTLKRYIDDLSVTGLTSNPTIFEHAISKSSSYDSEVRRLMKTRISAEETILRAGMAGPDTSCRSVYISAQKHGGHRRLRFA